jgi:translation initiation factor 5B
MTSNLRSPICVFLGHVNAGKTKLMDKLRNSSTQQNENGKITQQISTTLFTKEFINEQTKSFGKNIEIPGLLILDTPGHDCFDSIRLSGMSISDIAIIIVDIKKGLEYQTEECVKMLINKKIPFIVVANKLDNMYEWISIDNNLIKDSLAIQKPNALEEFNKYINNIICQMAKLEINADLYYKIKNFKQYISIVPVSSLSGEGISDLLMLITLLTQKLMVNKITSNHTMKCMLLESIKDDKYGKSFDVILINGELKIGDKLMILTSSGPITTTLQNIFTIEPMKELKNKNTFVSQKYIYASCSAKLIMKNDDMLNNVIVGTNIYCVNNEETLHSYKDKFDDELKSYLSIIDKFEIQKVGVYLQANSMGSLTALYHLTKEQKIPICGMAIGSISKKDLIKATNHNSKEINQIYSVILGFNITDVATDISLMAQEQGVTIITDNIIYNVLKKYDKYTIDTKNILKEKYELLLIEPMVLQILPQFIFRKKNPIIIGVKVKEGVLKVNTEVAIRKLGKIGKIISIQQNKKEIIEANKDMEVCIKIDSEMEYDKHFDSENILLSYVTDEKISIMQDIGHLSLEQLALAKRIAKLIK